MKNNKYKIIGFIILLIMFVFMCLLSEKQSFWIDELDWTINIIANPKLSMMISSLLNAGYNLPLFYLVLFPIYRIIPYGEFWMLLPNIIAIIVGIILLQKTGKKLQLENMGFYALCLACTSYTLIYQGAFEFRPYAFLFLFSSLTLCRYMYWLEDKNLKNGLLYVLSLILLAYTHWFGCLIIPFYFLYEVYLLIRKKNNFKFIIPYICLGFAFLPWLILMFIKHTSDFSKYWGIVPNVSDLVNTLRYLLSYNSINKILFLLGIILFFVYVFKKKDSKRQLLEICFGAIAFCIGIIFIYCRYINTSGSLYVLKYFFVLLPHIFIITAFPLAELDNLIATKLPIKDKKRKSIGILKNIIAIVVPIIIVIIIGISNYKQVYSNISIINEPYREASYLLDDNKNIYENNTAVVSSVSTGFITYYFEKRNVQIPRNVFYGTNDIFQYIKNGKRTNIKKLSKKTLLKYENIYLLNIDKNFDKKFLKFINENFELQTKEGNYYYSYARK